MRVPPAWSSLVAEAVGTFLFFVVGIGAVVVTAHAPDGGGGLVGVALAHGLALAVVVSALGAVSGAHVNPAVTLAVLISGRISVGMAAGYVAAQLVGGVAAALLVAGVMPADAVDAVAIGTPVLGEGVGALAGIVVEAALTVLLVLAVFGTAIDRRAPKIGGLAIGLAVAAGILAGGTFTGGAMNPARWFGPAVVSGTFADWYVWWIGPFAGAVIAAGIYLFALEDRAEPTVTPATPQG